MEAPIKTRYDKAGPQVAEALRRRRFEAHYVSTAQEALELALTLIPKDRTVSWGGTFLSDILQGNVQFTALRIVHDSF